MDIARYSLPALLLALSLPAWSQIVSTSPIPNGATPGMPSTPNVGPSYNTQAPVGSVGIGGTTTQVVPNNANPTGGSSFGSSGMSSSATTTFGGVSTLPGSPSSASSANLPGYTTPGTSSLPGYSAPPGTLTFPAAGGTSTPGVPSVNGALGGSGSSMNGELGGSSGSSGIGTTGSASGGLR